MDGQLHECGIGAVAARRRFIAAVVAGERAAVERFVERMRCVRRFLVGLNRRHAVRLRDDQLPDLVQEVWTEVWRRRGDYRGDAALETWVFRFCENTLRNAVRRARREAGRSAIEPDAVGARGDPVSAIDLRLAVGDALGELPADERVVVERKHFEEMTFEEVAAALGISPNTVKTRNYRALRAMARRLDTYADRTGSLGAMG